MDRIWAQMAGLAPAATSLLSQNDILYTHAQAYDIAHLSANDRNWINANDKRLLQASELFPVEFAIVAGGGTQQMEDTFVQPRFTCTYRYLLDAYNNNAKPTTLHSTACWGYTN